jgi:AraC-like DNA-binding protein/quercetin dioxygenase-like cupin family protein
MVGFARLASPGYAVGVAWSSSRALYQPFLPDGQQRAFVWKYSEALGGLRPRHFHAEPELNLVVRGSATFGVGRQVIEAVAGDLVAFLAGQDHVLLRRSPDLFLFAVGIDHRYVTDVVPAPSAPFHVSVGRSELAAVLDRAGTLVDRRGVGDATAELWQRMQWLGERAERRGPQAHVLTRRALQQLWRSPESKLEAIARDLRTGASEVSRHFHRDLGLSFARYRARVRLLSLFELVDAGRFDLGAAAAAAGFGSYSQCHRVFQAELGASPREFFARERADLQLVYSDRSPGLFLAPE